MNKRSKIAFCFELHFKMKICGYEVGTLSKYLKTLLYKFLLCFKHSKLLN